MDHVRVLFFDLDETLLDGRSNLESIRRTCEAVAAVRPGLDAGQLLTANTNAWQSYWPQVEEQWTLGRLDTRSVSLEAWRRALQACGCEDDSLAALATDTLFQLARETHRLFDDVAGLFEGLENRLPLALITNGASDLQREKLRATDIEDRFDAVVISGEVGFAKPDPRVFERALHRLDVKPDGVWHIGDSLRLDVGGAKAAGLTAVWLNRAGASRKTADPTPDIEVASLGELAALIEARI